MKRFSFRLLSFDISRKCTVLYYAQGDAMVIYLDVLLLSNLWVNALLLYAAAKITHTPLRKMRTLLASAAGAFFSLMIFLPALPLPILSLIRVAGALFMVTVAFGIRNIRMLLRQTVWLLLIILVFCGTVYWLASRLHAVGFYASNSFIYMDISLMVLLIGATIAAAVSTLISHRQDIADTSTYLLHIRISDKDFCMEALADTGNSLRDVFSGKPVVICAKNRIFSAKDDTAYTNLHAFRMLPVTTVTGKMLLPAFQPDFISICSYSAHKNERPLDVMLALTDEDTPAIVPACCLRIGL